MFRNHLLFTAALIVFTLFASSCGQEITCAGLSGLPNVWAPYDEGNQLVFRGEDSTNIVFQVPEVLWSMCYTERCFGDCECLNSVGTFLTSADTNFACRITHEERGGPDDPRDRQDVNIGIQIGPFFTNHRPNVAGWPSGLVEIHPEFEVDSVTYNQVHEFRIDTNSTNQDLWRIYINQNDGLLQFSTRSKGEWVYDPN